MMKNSIIFIVLLCGCNPPTFISNGPAPIPPPPSPPPTSQYEEGCENRYEEGYESGLAVGKEKGTLLGYDGGYHAGYSAGRDAAVLQMSKDGWVRVEALPSHPPTNTLADLRSHHKDTSAMREIRRKSAKGAFITVEGTVYDIGHRSYPDLGPDKNKKYKITIHGTGENKNWVINAMVDDNYISIFNKDDAVVISGEIYDIGEVDWVELTNHEISKATN